MWREGAEGRVCGRWVEMLLQTTTSHRHHDVIMTARFTARWILVNGAPERWFLCLDLVSICVSLFLAQLPHRAHDGIAQSFLFALLQVA